jgi:hypothetical protein
MKTYHEKVHWTLKKNVPFKNKVVWVEEEDDGTLTIYHTESPFWYNFFHGEECPRVSQVSRKCPTMTHVDKVICNDESKLEFWM